MRNSENENFIFQIAIKAINDFISPNGLMPILLIFGVYLRLLAELPPLPPIFKKAAVIRKAIIKFKNKYNTRKIANALAIRNSLNINPIFRFPLNAEMLI